MNVDGVNEVNMLLTESGPLSVHSIAEQATSVEPSQGLVCASGEIHDHPAESRDDYEAASTTITPLEHLSSGNAQSAGEWADSLTNISIGDLLSEVPDDIDSDGVDPPATEGSHYLLRDVPFASDSFDAAIAAHILRHQNKPSALLPLTSGSSSLWDDEETRDAFSFQKNRLADSTELASVASHRVNGEPSQLVEVTISVSNSTSAIIYKTKPSDSILSIRFYPAMRGLVTLLTMEIQWKRVQQTLKRWILLGRPLVDLRMYIG